MSLLFPKNSNNFNYDEPFNKHDIIEEIKEKLPEPWMWYTINDCMDGIANPYDFLIIRNKEVTEEFTHTRPFSSVIRKVDSIYSIILGINVVDRFSSKKQFEMSLVDTLVTAGIEVNSAATLFAIIKEIDSREGGIKNANRSY